MGKLALMATIVFALALQLSAQSRARSNKIMDGTWAYKKVVTARKKQHYTAPNECGFWDGLTINNSIELPEFTYGGIQFRGQQIGISGEKVCVTSPITFQLEVERNACYTTWIRLIDQPDRLIRSSEGGVFEYKIKRLSKRSMLLLKVQELTNYGLQVPDSIELEWVKGV